MIAASYQDKGYIVDILSAAFDENKSVNYVVKQDQHRASRIRLLMEYSFEQCWRAGRVLLSKDRKACALVLFPDQKKTSLNSIWWDLKLVFGCMGLSNTWKAFKREKLIQAHHPNSQSIYYLWFIGTDPTAQGGGIGSKLLDELLVDSREKNRSIYLETSTLKNVPWYKKHGGEIYADLDFGYTLHLMHF